MASKRRNVRVRKSTSVHAAPEVPGVFATAAAGAAEGITAGGGVITFAVPTINFVQGTASSHDLRQYYVADIPAGEVVTGMTVYAGSLQTGVTLNAATEALDYDGVAAVASVSGIQIEVVTAGEEITTFTLAEAA